MAEAMATAISNHKGSIEALSENVKEIQNEQKLAMTTIPENAENELHASTEEVEAAVQVCSMYVCVYVCTYMCVYDDHS